MLHELIIEKVLQRCLSPKETTQIFHKSIHCSKLKHKMLEGCNCFQVLPCDGNIANPNVITFSQLADFLNNLGHQPQPVSELDDLKH